MSWDFQPAAPAAAQLLVNDGLAVGAGVTVSAVSPDGSASGVAYNSCSVYRQAENHYRVASKFSLAAKLLLYFGVQLVVATGAGVSDTASAPSGTAAGAAAAAGAGVSVSTSAPSATATGGNQGTAIGAGASVTTTAPGGSATGAGAATGAGGSGTASAPAGLASGQDTSFLLRTAYRHGDRVWSLPARARAIGRLLILNFGAGNAIGAGSTSTALAPSGSANGGGVPGAAVGTGVEVQAFPPAGTAAPPAPFALTTRTSVVSVHWSNSRSVALRLLLTAQAPGAASGPIGTATASPPAGGASGNSTNWLVRQAKYFEESQWTPPARSITNYLTLLNSFGPDYPTVLQSQWDDSFSPPSFYAGRRYQWTLIVLGQVIASASGTGSTVVASAPSGFATGDNAGLATGAGSTASAAAPSGAATGNTNVIAAGISVVASPPAGSAAGPGAAQGAGVTADAITPDGAASGGGAGVAVGGIDTVTASAPSGTAGASYEAFGAGVTVAAFEVNATAVGDAVAIGSIGTVTTSAPETSGPVTIGEVRITISQHRTRITIS